MAADQRLVVVAAAVLFGSMFLPWYTTRALFPGRAVELSLSAFGAFSFVEAAVLLVAAAAVVLVFARAERKAFHLPGGDGAVVLGAGLWSALLLVWRLFDKPDVSGTRAVGATVGVEWGIFVALAAAGLLAYAGARVRAAHRPEPPLPGARRRETAPEASDDEVWLADERPHLDKTQVIASQGRTERPSPRTGGQAPGDPPG